MSFVKEVSVGQSKKLTNEQKKKSSELVEKAMKEDARLVKGVFKNLECPGGDLEFAYRAYKGEPVRVYRFLDGETYEIPIGVAKHLNKQCKYKKSQHLVDKNGNKMVGAGKPIDRYQFVSTDFM